MSLDIYKRFLQGWCLYYYLDLGGEGAGLKQTQSRYRQSIGQLAPPCGYVICLGFTFAFSPVQSTLSQTLQNGQCSPNNQKGDLCWYQKQRNKLLNYFYVQSLLICYQPHNIHYPGLSWEIRRGPDWLVTKVEPSVVHSFLRDVLIKLAWLLPSEKPISDCSAAN
jgi:hypothetical protein